MSTVLTLSFFRVILSDGNQYIQALADVQVSNLIKNGVFKKNTVIKLTNYDFRHINEKRFSSKKLNKN